MPLQLTVTLASVKSRLVLLFWDQLTRVVPDKCVCVCYQNFKVACQLKNLTADISVGSSLSELPGDQWNGKLRLGIIISLCFLRVFSVDALMPGHVSVQTSRCCLLLPMLVGLCVCVCLSVCWSQPWAVLKWPNQWRCRLGRGRVGAQGTTY